MNYCKRQRIRASNESLLILKCQNGISSFGFGLLKTIGVKILRSHFAISSLNRFLASFRRFFRAKAILISQIVISSLWGDAYELTYKELSRLKLTIAIQVAWFNPQLFSLKVLWSQFVILRLLIIVLQSRHKQLSKPHNGNLVEIVRISSLNTDAEILMLQIETSRFIRLHVGFLRIFLIKCILMFQFDTSSLCNEGHRLRYKNEVASYDHCFGCIFYLLFIHLRDLRSQIVTSNFPRSYGAFCQFFKDKIFLRSQFVISNLDRFHHYRKELFHGFFND